MAQYCRYCAYMVCGDANWCTEKKKTFTDKQICSTNKCKDFELNPIDALGINAEEYKPRKPREKNEEAEQLWLTT